MTNNEYNEAIEIVKSIKLPTHPEILLELNKETSKEDPSRGTIINIASKDVSISAKTIKFANSPFFGLRIKADTVDEAFNFLGLDNFKNIILASVMKDALRDKSIPASELEQYFDHSIIIAQIANYVTDHLPFEVGSKINQKIAYVYGLFHDCGVMILARKYPDYFKQVKWELTKTESLKEAELNLFKTHHAHVGSLLAKSWFLNDEVVQCIQAHHTKDLGLIEDPMVRKHVSILILAEIICDRTYPKSSETSIYKRNGNEDMIDSVLMELQMDSKSFETLERSVYSLLN